MVRKIVKMSNAASTVTLSFHVRDLFKESTGNGSNNKTCSRVQSYKNHLGFLLATQFYSDVKPKKVGMFNDCTCSG